MTALPLLNSTYYSHAPAKKNVGFFEVKNFVGFFTVEDNIDRNFATKLRIHIAQAKAARYLSLV